MPVKLPNLWVIFGADHELAEDQDGPTVTFEPPRKTLLAGWDLLHPGQAPHYGAEYTPIVKPERS